MVQTFKGDETELKMLAVAEPVFKIASAALDSFYAEGFNSNPFLTMLYDDKRIPFSNRIEREPFLIFIKEALGRFPFTGTFDVYLFILFAIFGEDSDITFEVPAPGKLSIAVNSIADLEYEFISREFINGAYQFDTIGDHDDDVIVFRGISGIETEYELGLLFSEIMPAGIVPDISMNFFSEYDFVALYSSGDSFTYDMITSGGDQLIFIEVGG